MDGGGGRGKIKHNARVKVGGKYLSVTQCAPPYSRSREFYRIYRSGSKSTVQKLSSNMLTLETKGVTK